MQKEQFITVIIPIFNEEQNIHPLCQAVQEVCSSITNQFEVVFVNDGSTDSSLENLNKFRSTNPWLKIISFSRNFGHQKAIMAGLDCARGDLVVIMDGDFQDPPELIRDFYQKWLEGNQVVYGIRKSRKEGLLLSFFYKLFYRILNMVSDVSFPLDVGDFCLMDRCVVDNLKKFHEGQIYLRGLRFWVGFKQVGVEYDRPGRTRGKPKYSYFSLINLALDGLLSFSNVFLRISTVLGLLISFASFCYGMITIVIHFLNYFQIFQINVPPKGWTSLFVLNLFFIGLIFVFIGVIGEYLGRVYTEVKKRPLYIISQKIGFD